MKIGVLTFHRCINYGSYWQARCLVHGLGSLGHDAVLLDHASRRIDRAEWKCALHPVPEAHADRPAYRRKMQRFFEAFASLPLSPRFPLDEPAQMPACDAVVVGSDEVWNLSHPWYGRVPLFYGDGLRAPLKIAYAASFGHHVEPDGLDRAWARRLDDFDAISVRDDASRSIVAGALATEVPVVLDPCLAFPPDVADTPASADGQAYVALYGHDFSPAFGRAVRDWARHRGWPVISIGYRSEWADRQWIDAGPHEFAAFMANAGAVATTFFHGCVFALRFGRPFVCEGSWYRGTKLRCLMDQIGSERHLVNGSRALDGGIDRLLDVPLPEAFATRIAALQQTSRHFLREALRAPEAVA